MGVGMGYPGEAMNLAKQMLHREDFFGGRMDFQIGVGVFLGSWNRKMFSIQADGVAWKPTHWNNLKKKWFGKIFQEFLFVEPCTWSQTKSRRTIPWESTPLPSVGLVVETSHPHNRIVRLIPFLGHTNGSLGIVVPHMSVLYWFALVLVSPPQFLRFSSYGYESYIRI